MLKLSDLYKGSKSDRDAAVEELGGKTRRQPKTGRKVACPTIWRAHTCPPCLHGTACSENNESTVTAHFSEVRSTCT